MDFNLVSHLESCVNIIEQNSDFVRLIYYSHIPVSVVALLVGGFVIFKGRPVLLSRILFSIAISFTVWSLLDLVAWMGTDSRLIMFSWSLLGIVNSLIFILSLYFVYVFACGYDLSFWKKIALSAILFPIIILTPTNWNLTLFNTSACGATEGTSFVNYYYLIDFILVFGILLVEVIGYRRARGNSRMKVLLLAVGINLFLFSFFVTGYLASALGAFKLVVYGLFGMAVFMAFLGYIIVQYNAFDTPLLGTQALVVSLIVLIGSQFFYVKSNINFVLTAITFLLVVTAGIILIRSYKRDQGRKEQLQRMADHLALANDKLRELDNAKSEFISIASHQLRTPLTAIKGYISLVLEGAYGKLDPTFSEVLDKVYISNERLIQLVENLLNISRMESGRMQYRFEQASLEKIVRETVDAFFLAAKNKRLELKLEMSEGLPLMQLDIQKIQEAISNLIDNALKYTKEGSVVVKVENLKESVRIAVQDSGIGIPAAEIPGLFSKFSRGKDIGRLHATGTGLGLYVVKNLVEAHGGTIRVESEGEGKGSKFVMDIPKDVKQISNG